MTLTEFLLARIAEDEAVAREAIAARARANARGTFIEPEGPEPDLLMAWDDHPGPGVCLIGPERVLAECEAKRRIVAALGPLSEDENEFSGWTDLAERQLLALAAVYAGHPDYREEWKV